MRLVSLLLLGLSSVFAQDLTALKFNGTGIVISSDEAHMTTFRKSLTSTSNGGFTAFTTVTLNENTIRPEEQTLVTYANWNNIQNADSVIRLSLVNVTSTSFQLRFQLLNGTLPSNSSLSSIFTSTVKSFDTSIIDKSFQLMFAFNPEATSSAFYRFGVNGLAAPIYEASSTTSTNPSYVPKQPTWVALKADVGKAELRFGGKVWNAAQGRVESPFYGTLEQVSFHSVLFSQLQSAEVYKSHRNIAQPNVFLANAQIDEAKFAPNGGYYQFQSSNAVLNRNSGVFNFSGAAYSGMTENAAKTPIHALSYGCDANINAQLQYVLLGSTFTCPTPTTQTPVVTDAPTSATTATPTTQAPTNTVTDAPTSPTTSAPTTPVTTDAPTTPVTTEAPTTPVTTQPPTTPVTTDAPTTPVTTEAPTTPVTTQPPTTPVTTEAPTTPVTTEAPTTPVTTEAPTTPVTTEAPTTPVTTEAPTTPVNVTTAPTTPVTTDAPTSTPTPTTPVNVTDAPTSTPAPTTPVNVTDAPSSTPTPTTTVNVTDAPSSTPTSSTTPTPTNTVTDAPTPTPTPTTETPTKGPVVDTPSSSSSTGVLSVNGAETTSLPIFGAIMSVIIAALL